MWQKDDDETLVTALVSGLGFLVYFLLSVEHTSLLDSLLSFPHVNVFFCSPFLSFPLALFLVSTKGYRGVNCFSQQLENKGRRHWKVRRQKSARLCEECVWVVSQWREREETGLGTCTNNKEQGIRGMKKKGPAYYCYSTCSEQHQRRGG